MNITKRLFAILIVAIPLIAISLVSYAGQLVLRQSTSATVMIGPAVDSTDGATLETALTIDAGDVLLSKNGGAFAAKNSGGCSAASTTGYYACTFNATDTSTVGTLQVSVAEAGALPIYHEFQVLEEAIYDADYTASATGRRGLNLDSINATNGAPALGLDANGTLNGTHTSTVADLGTNAPGTTSQLAGMTLTIPSKHFSAVITSYNTSTGEATFSPSTSLTLANGDAWFLHGTASASGGSNITQIEGTDATDAIDARITAANILRPTVPGRTLDVSSTGEAGIDLANVGSPTTVVNLSGTTISTSQAVASVSGNIGGTVNGLTTTAQGNVRTGLGMASNNMDTQLAALQSDADNIQTRLPTSLVSGRMDSSAGAMASGVLTGTAIATDAFTAAKFHADVAAEFANATWSLDATSQQTPGSFGQAIGDPGADTDSIWSLANLSLDATVGSRSTQTSVDAIGTAITNLPSSIRNLIIDDQGGGVSLGCALAISLAYVAGDLSTTGATPVYEDPSGTETRISATIASNGNRTVTITCPTY